MNPQESGSAVAVKPLCGSVRQRDKNKEQLTVPQAEPDTLAVFTEEPDNSEQLLISRVCERDQQAFRQLYELHVDWIHALCYRLTGNRASAEEATQEIFLRVWDKIASFNGESSFRTWLHSVATRGAISWQRRQKSWLERIQTATDSPEEANMVADAATDLSPLDRLLPRLPERARMVFVLHAIEGYRHEDIARTMKITIGASKAHFHRARQMIGQWLEE